MSRESSEREEMPCPDCGGEGYLRDRGCECEWCAGTGCVYVPLPLDAWRDDDPAGQEQRDE